MLRAKSYATLGAAAAAGADEEPFRRFKSITVCAGNAPVKPTFSPLEFDNFIPWVCKQWCASTAVIITRKIQEPYIKFGSRKTTRSRSKLVPRPKITLSLEETDSAPCSLVPSLKELKVMGERVIPVTAYYDTRQRLVEISIIGCQATISRVVINAFSLSFPYHSMLCRFTFRRSGLTDQLIYEINKLLPISNISEICFDDSYVREGNYYILLDQPSQLRYLSLNRCKINDAVCQKIFENLRFGNAANTLQILELGSNDITDIGAKFIASVLKVNRSLLHLNLSGNKITDQGFIPILECLMEFPLTDEDNMAMKRRKIAYLQNKLAVYSRCLDELKYGKLDEMESTTSAGRRMTLKRLRRKSRKVISQQSVQDVAEVMARGIVGEFHDPFSPLNLVTKDDGLYAKGNFVLSYINIAYNNLEYPSVQKLCDVAKYQNENNMTLHTGLIRVILEGNYIPKSCWEFDEIDKYFKKVLTLKTSGRKTRTSSLLRRLYGTKLSPAST